MPSGGASLFTDASGAVHALSQHDFYRDRVFNWDATVDGVVPDMTWWYVHARGIFHAEWKRWNLERGLETLNLLQYVTHVDVVKKPEKFEIKSGRGTNVRYYLLNRNNPLHVSHIQRLKPRDHVAALSGKTPVRPRGECPEEEGRARRR